MTPTRSCGPCSACCTALGVRELAKTPGVACAHLAAVGCAIYDERPASCRAFVCAWLAGRLGRDDERPDLLGVVYSEPFGVATCRDPGNGRPVRVAAAHAGRGGLARVRAARPTRELLRRGFAVAAHDVVLWPSGREISVEPGGLKMSKDRRSLDVHARFLV